MISAHHRKILVPHFSRISKIKRRANNNTVRLEAGTQRKTTEGGIGRQKRVLKVEYPL
jgi:hypothetical protein